MTVWIIEPRDPLIVRDARPFGPNPGARANTLNFPFPSTLIGALRTRAGTENGQFNTNRIDELLKATMRGPLLVELADDDTISQYYLPAPADALIYRDSETQDIRRVCLSPRTDLEAAISNKCDDLCYIGPKDFIKGKAYSDAPSFWNAADFMQWLETPEDSLLDLKSQEPHIKNLPKESRMHVSINKDTQTGEDGLLYLTSGLEFVRIDSDKDDEYAKKFYRLALAMDFDGKIEHFDTGLSPIGGERRLMHWRKRPLSFAEDLNAKKEAIISEIIEKGTARVILLTPAYFCSGFRPDLKWTLGGVTAKVKGVVNQRYQTVSGWDFKQNADKATTRLAPAGSVYFVDFAGLTKDSIRTWCEAVWLKNVSDDAVQKDDGSVNPHAAQWRRDGFGLAILGIWQ